jgi:hypothetical protein
MQKNHLISRLTSIGLITILLVLTGFSIWSVLTTQQTGKRAVIAEYLNDQYQQARFAIGAEESLEREYRLEPGPEPRAGHTAAAAALVAAIYNVARGGDAHDRRVVAQVLAIHRLYLLATHQMFAVMDKGNAAFAMNLAHNKIDPIFSSMQQRVDVEAISYHIEADHDRAELAATEHLVFVTTLIVFPVGLILLDRQSDRSWQSPRLPPGSSAPVSS